MKASRLAVLALLLALPLTACKKGGGTGPTEEDISGTYTLRTVNGGSLPATLTTGTNGTFKVVAMSRTLLKDGTFTSVEQFSNTKNGVTTNLPQENDNGKWVRSGASITLTNAGGDKEVHQLSGTSLTTTITDPDVPSNKFIMVFQR